MSLTEANKDSIDSVKYFVKSIRLNYKISNNLKKALIPDELMAIVHKLYINKSAKKLDEKIFNKPI